jgi:MFS family permease
MTKSPIQSVIRRYYGFQFFFNLLLWVPVFYAIQKSSGLSDPQIFAIQSLYYIGFVLFEIPTGYFADRWGYRLSMRCGAVTLIAANLLPMFSSNYAGFLVHFLLIGLARSLISGASSAYLYDFLKSHGDTSKYKEIEGKARSLGLIGKVICWPTVGFLMNIYLFLPYAITAVNGVVALIFSIRLPDIRNHNAVLVKDNSGLLGLVKNFQGAIRELSENRFLLLVMIQGIGLFVLERINQVNLFQPVLAHKNFDVSQYGWIMAAMTLCEAYSATKSKFIARYLNDAQAVFVLTIVIASSLSLTAISGQVGTVASFCLFSIATGLAFPIQKQLLNDHINDNSRATMLSMESVLDRIVSAAAVAPLGGLVAAGKINTVLHSAALIIILSVGVVFSQIRKKAYA